MNRWPRLGAGPSGRSGSATPLGAELHPCTHGSHEPNMGTVTAHSREFGVGLDSCLDICRVCAIYRGDWVEVQLEKIINKFYHILSTHPAWHSPYVVDLQTAFFDCFNVLMSFLAKKLMQNDLEVTSKSQFWTQSMQNSKKTTFIRTCPGGRWDHGVQWKCEF